MGLMEQPIRIPPRTRVRLKEFDPGDTSLCSDKEEAQEAVEKHVRRMADLQRVLFADGKHALLIVLQAMDGGGKDGTIRHVMTGLNPQGCRVTGFRVPTPEELSHDFLWRVHREVPALGWIGIFNRSHYEDVLAARVRKLVPSSVWRKRYAHINAFEKLLAESGVTILKFFLHISKREQKDRLKRRLEDPKRAWKADPVDWENRKLWNAYMDAYEDAITLCNTPWAPWHVVPADKKWYRNLVVSERIVRALDGLRLRYPRRPAWRGKSTAD
jgi:PPK2 family polyphosphate:nucleotide phosphotransferase